MNNFVIAIHGGAGTMVQPAEVPGQVQVPGQEQAAALRRIISEGYEFARSNLDNGQITVVDVVEYVATLLENEGLFNAGYGSVYNTIGKHELEASIMDGSTGQSGAVCYVKTLKNPIKAARKVMECTPHCLLAGEAACAFGASMGCETVENSYFDTKRRLFQLQTVKAEALISGGHGQIQNSEDTSVEHSSAADEAEASKFTAEEESVFKAQQETNQRTGTIGCVAMYKGSTAAATSTGGMTNKFAGRVGDSSLIGCGNYANNATCAISCTGIGELFIRHTVASTVAHRIRFAKESLQDAVKNTIYGDLPEDIGGAIAVDLAGNVSMEFNTKGMCRAQCRHLGSETVLKGEPNSFVAIWDQKEHFNL